MKNIVILMLFASLIGGLACRKNYSAADTNKMNVLILAPGFNNPRNSEGDFITLKDGRIMFVYSHFTGRTDHDSSPAYLAARYSADSGRTWTKKDQIVVPPEDAANSMSASLLRLKDGAIALFYLRKKSSQDCIPMMQISYDEAKTWSTPVPCITDKKGYFILNNCRVIQLASGRILVPVALHRTLEENVLQNKGRLFCYWSDDNGKTWHSSKEVPNPGGVITQEPGLVELKNNSVMMVIRTPMNLQYISTSKDSGKTWNAVYPSKIKSPVSPATISRIPFTNDLMLVWNNNDGNNPAIQGRRTPFNVALSNDEGDNWNAIKTLEDDPDGWYCYSAVHYVGHRYILLAYCAGSFSRGTGLAVTKIVRIKTDWLYSHED